MATHKLELYYEAEFDDGTKREIPFPNGHIYYFRQQESTYLTNWLEDLIREENITAKPLFIRECYKVIECEQYATYIGV